MKKGFTLIELLAVIVILAIIALIATPIVLNIINDSKNSAVMRSADFYLDGVENAIMKKNLATGGNFLPDTVTITEEGNMCDGIYEDSKCNGEIIEVEIDGEKPTGGIIQFSDSGTVFFIDGFEIGGKVVSTDYNGEIIESPNRVICQGVTEETKTTGNIPKGKYAAGDEYICRVKEGVEYHFFVVSVEGDKVNLILDRNINSDGTLATKNILKTSPEAGIYTSTEWISVEDYLKTPSSFTCDYSACTEKGPITAMAFLDKATKDWDNIENLNYTYSDENINSSNNTTGSTGYDTLNLNGKARLPKYSEVAGDGKCSGYSEKVGGSCPKYLINYLMNLSNYNFTGMETISNIAGYWTLSSRASVVRMQSYAVIYPGYMMLVSAGKYTYTTDKNIGVRPVITVNKISLK